MVTEDSDKWFIWQKKGRPPAFAHETREAAMAEAERLAHKHPGVKFHVMHGVAKVHVPNPQES